MYKNDDTVLLLEQVNAGLKMGVASIDDMLKHSGSARLTELLEKSRDVHVHLGDETHAILNELGEKDKNPPAMARAMSAAKTGITMATEESDSSIAALMTDGCDMGVKSLSRYLNEYPRADSRVRSIASRLIAEEEHLEKELRRWL